MRYVYLTFLLIGCGKQVTYPIPVEFQPYVFRFQAYYGKQFSDIEYVSRDLNSSDPTGYRITLGTCTPKYYSGGTIEIDSFYWSISSESTREQVMFHELGHCVLHRAHRDDSAGFVPNSMMNSFLLGDAVYNKNRDNYINELFNHLQPLMLHFGIMVL